MVQSLQPVAGNRFPIAMAQCFDILIDAPKTGAFPILARLEDGRRQTGIILSTPGSRTSQMTDSAKAAPPLGNSGHHPHDRASRREPYAWSMNGEYSPQVTLLMLAKGKRVEIDLVNHSM